MINVSAFLSSLIYMLQGLVGIFIVTAIIIICVFVLNKLGAAMDAKNNNSNGQ